MLFAVIKEGYEVKVYDEYVISGNSALLRCQLPSYVSEFVMVTSWIQDSSINIYPSSDISKFLLTYACEILRRKNLFASSKLKYN